MSNFKEENSNFYDLEYFLSLEYRHYSGANASRLRNIFKALPPVAGLSVLDVGCGGGLMTEEFQKLGAHVMGIDYSSFAIQFACDRFKDVKFLKLSAYDMEALPPQSYDIVALFDVIEHLGDYEKLFRGIRHVLKPGGIFVVSTDCDDSRWHHGIVNRITKVLQMCSAEGLAYRLIKKVEAHRKTFRNYHASHISGLSYGDLEHEISGAGFMITTHRVYPLIGVPLRDWLLPFLPLSWQGDHQVIVATR